MFGTGFAQSLSLELVDANLTGDARAGGCCERGQRRERRGSRSEVLKAVAALVGEVAGRFV